MVGLSIMRELMVVAALAGCWSGNPAIERGGTIVATPAVGATAIGRIGLGAEAIAFRGEIEGAEPRLEFTAGAIEWRSYATARACFRFDRWALGDRMRDPMDRRLVLESSDGAKLVRWGATRAAFGEVRVITWRERVGETVEDREARFQRAFADVCFDLPGPGTLITDTTTWIALRDGAARYEFAIDRTRAVVKPIEVAKPVARLPLAATTWHAKARMTAPYHTPPQVTLVDLEVRLSIVGARPWIALVGDKVMGCNLAMTTPTPAGVLTMVAQRYRCGAGTIESAELDLVARTIRIEMDEGIEHRIMFATL